MRVFFLTLFIFTASLLLGKDAHTRLLTLDAQGIHTLQANCGGGFLKIKGVPALPEIRVSAEIRSHGVPPQKIEHLIELSLKREGDRAVLVGQTKDTDISLMDWILGHHSNVEIDLTIEIPQSLNLSINDGAGFIDIQHIKGNVKLTDGSGYLTLKDVEGNVHINDGSGGMQVQDINGNCTITDGSGEMTLQNISGDVTIHDGSGAMVIDNVNGRLEITDGSGDIEAHEVRKNMIVYDGSGDIRVNGLDGDLIIKADGSGGLFTQNIRGKVIGLRH